VPVVPAAVPGVIARFAAEVVMVVPVTLSQGSDSAGWRQAAGGEGVLRTMADSVLEASFRGRGLSAWVYAGQLARTARRNPTYLVDPSTLRPAFALRNALRSPDRSIAEPLASQLRALAGTSGARYTLVPTDLEARPGGTRLTLALIDVRLAQVHWIGTVTGEARTTWDHSIITDLMERAADLVVPR